MINCIKIICFITKSYSSHLPKTRTDNMVKAEIWSHQHHPTSLQHHIYLMKKELRPIREYCNTSFVSIKYLLFECPSLTEERRSLPNPTNLKDILKIENLPHLIYFLKNTYLYNKILIM